MRITQLYSQFGYYFKEGAMLKWSLIPYKDVHSPVLMIGCYNHHQLAISLNHRNLCVIYWGGSDAKALVDAGPDNFWADQYRKKNNIKHIASSHWIKEDLDSLGIPNYFLPISLFSNSSLSPCRLGDSVYMYNPESPIYNGMGLYAEIKKRLPGINFIEAKVGDYPHEKMVDVYRECFVGLRFTEHDGMSETAVEMGLLGRQMIHNGDLPNCIRYNKGTPVEWFVDKILEIHKERLLMSYTFKNHDLSDAVNKFLHHSDDWLHIEYYDNVRKDAICKPCDSKECDKCNLLDYHD